jgi:hypothetical protein
MEIQYPPGRTGKCSHCWASVHVDRQTGLVMSHANINKDNDDDCYGVGKPPKASA